MSIPVWATETNSTKTEIEQKLVTFLDLVFGCLERHCMKPTELAERLGCRTEKISRIIYDEHKRNANSRPERRLVLAMAAIFREYSKEEWIYAAYPEEKIYDEIYYKTEKNCLAEIDEALYDAGYPLYSGFHR